MADERNVDNINIRILQNEFIAMYNAHKTHPASQTIHLNQITKQGDYVTPKKFDGNLMPRWTAYRQAHNGDRPPAIWTVAPPTKPPVVNKPALILTLETALGGTINRLTDWINLLIKKGVYSHYNCMRYMTFEIQQKYGLKLAIQRVTNGGLNCADYVALTVKVLEALKQMGVNHTWVVRHVLCNDSRGVPNPDAGHFLLHVDNTDCDPAEAASGARGMPHNMCYYNYSKIIGSKLC